MFLLNVCTIGFRVTPLWLFFQLFMSLKCFPLDLPPPPLPPPPLRPRYSDIMLVTGILLIEQTVAIYVYQARLLAVLYVAAYPGA